ncbi:MAG TPA: EamA family transporter [Steroidobacteraceae bacterium]|nr:EamA family transporter [Steroidobacteraceae bacterium]
MRTEYLYIVAAALFWGSYPLVLRSTGAGGPSGSLILMVGGLIPIVAAVLWQGTLIKPPTAELTRLLIAGVMMGFGLLAFNMVANSRVIDASVSIPIVDTAMLIVTVIGAVLFFAEPVTVKKAVGIALLVTGILVLRPE